MKYTLGEHTIHIFDRDKREVVLSFEELGELIVGIFRSHALILYALARQSAIIHADEEEKDS